MKHSSNPPLDFTGYIQSLRVTDTVQGDFIRDAQRDIKLVNARSWKDLKEYFDFFPTLVSDDVYVSAKIVWRKYRAKYPAYLEVD